MAGIRVQHPTARSCRFTVIDKRAPYPVPFRCSPPEFGGCGSTHDFKAHHLNLDETGSAIVSEGVFERISGILAANGFRVANEVEKPPTLLIGINPSRPGATPGIEIVRIE